MGITCAVFVYPGLLHTAIPTPSFWHYHPYIPFNFLKKCFVYFFIQLYTKGGCCSCKLLWTLANKLATIAVIDTKIQGRRGFSTIIFEVEGLKPHPQASQLHMQEYVVTLDPANFRLLNLTT